MVAFNRQNLYLCEFICHGVPSPSVFRAYIDNINKKNNSLITKFKFRCKDHGWNQSGLQLGVEYETNQNKHKRIFPAFMDEYMCGFLEDIFLRPSCYDCKFKRIPKKTCDITIADFWGIDSVDKRFNDGKGTSLVLVHGEHGQQLLDAVQGRLYLHEVDYHKAIRKNPPLLKSAKLSEERRAFFSELRSKGYSKVSKKYMNTHKWLFSTAWRILGNIIEKIVFTALALIGIKATEKKLTTIRQFIQFCIVGVSNALVSYVINIITLTLQRPLGFRYDYMVANVTAFVLSVLWSYHWNNRYVFAEGADKRSRKKTLLKAYATYAFSGIVLNNALSTLWIRVIGFSKYLAPLLNIPFSMPVNFLISKFWTYREKREIK
ncbi:GtrA family protein [Butyrivibrio sp. INlla14]|uniref:GtrA family protein n=1 Tax=Butyrivibrio sp. INlla14 TaxID=1520808 RepID=UPI002100D39F|nr:GtrA family protein [Butyrivibrio sp. INlla14]